jgi:hypothetical protein
LLFLHTEVNNPRSAALANACAGKAHARFSEAAGAPDKITLLWVKRQILLKCRAVTVWKTLDYLGEV